MESLATAVCGLAFAPVQLSEKLNNKAAVITGVARAGNWNS